MMAAAERRKQEQKQMRNTQAPGLPSLHQHHRHSMNNPIGGYLGRPDINQAHTFPTPLTSASSITGKIESSDEKFQTRPQEGIREDQGSKLPSIDTGLSNAHSIPTTPATTPPGTQIQSIQQYQQIPWAPHFKAAPHPGHYMKVAILFGKCTAWTIFVRLF